MLCIPALNSKTETVKKSLWILTLCVTKSSRVWVSVYESFFGKRITQPDVLSAACVTLCWSKECLPLKYTNWLIDCLQSDSPTVLTKLRKEIYRVRSNYLSIVGRLVSSTPLSHVKNNGVLSDMTHLCKLNTIILPLLDSEDLIRSLNLKTFWILVRCSCH